jgi:hypothetical protein
LTMTTRTLEIIANSMQTPFLGAIINTTQAVLENVQVTFVERSGFDVKAYLLARPLPNTKMTVFSFWNKSKNC